MRNSAVADAELGPLFGANAHVRRRGGMGDHALASPRLLEISINFKSIQRLEGCPLPLDVEGDGRREIGHLAAAGLCCGWSGRPG